MTTGTTGTGDGSGRRRGSSKGVPSRVLPAGLAPVFVACLLLAAPSGAQILSAGSSGGSGRPLVYDEVLSRVGRAFESTVERFRDRLGSLPAAELEEFESLHRSLQDRFLESVESELDHLIGDGLLESGEVERGLGPLWEETRSELEQAVTALEAGLPVPPVGREYDDHGEFLADILEYTFLVRNGWLDWLELCGWILGALLLAWAAHALLRRGSGKLAERGLRWSADVLDSMAAPLYATAVIVGLFFGLSAVWLPGIAVVAVPRTLTALLTLSLFWLFWHLCGPAASLIGWLFNRSYSPIVDRHVLVVIARLLRLVVLVVFVVLLAREVLDSNVTGIVASLGVLGLAVALALRGTLRNVFASLTLFADGPFRIDDMVIFDGVWGWIEDIGVRSTKFRSLDGHVISIPNQELVDQAIQNVSRRPFVRRRFRLGLVYSTPPEKIREAVEILEDLLSDYEGCPEGWPANVVFESFGDYDLKLLVQYYFEPPDYWQALHFDSEVNLRILERFTEAGIEFAFPTETTIVENAGSYLQGGGPSEPGEQRKERGRLEAPTSQEAAAGDHRQRDKASDTEYQQAEEADSDGE